MTDLMLAISEQDIADLAAYVAWFRAVRGCKASHSLLQRLSDPAMEPTAGVECVRLRDVGESKQQALPACRRGRAARQSFHRETGSLRKRRQFDVADAGGEPRDQVHPARLEIDANATAEDRGQAVRQRAAARRIQRLHPFEMAREVACGHEIGND